MGQYFEGLNLKEKIKSQRRNHSNFSLKKEEKIISPFSSTNTNKNVRNY